MSKLQENQGNYAKFIHSTDAATEDQTLSSQFSFWKII